MKGFKLVEGADGRMDVCIANGKIEVVSGDELTRQTLETVLSTNRGEWALNKKEGINRRVILSKRPDADRIRDEITSGIVQVDEAFHLKRFECDIDRKARKIAVSFTAETENGGTTIEGSVNYA